MLAIFAANNFLCLTVGRFFKLKRRTTTHVTTTNNDAVHIISCCKTFATQLSTSLVQMRTGTQDRNRSGEMVVDETDPHNQFQLAPVLIDEATLVDTEGELVRATQSSQFTIRYRARDYMVGIGISLNVIFFWIAILNSYLAVEATKYYADLSAMHAILGTFFGLLSLIMTPLIVRWWVESRPIKLSKTGIEFSTRWSKNLLNRLEREWSDVHSVDFSGTVAPTDIANWSFLSGLSITIDFKSGGSALLELGRMERSEAEELFLFIERWADQSVLSRRALLFERNLMAVETAEKFDYTAIWTDALESQFGTTHFCPLKTGARLQSGRYEVRMQLASGGLSAVYLALESLPQENLGKPRRLVLKESVLPADIDDWTRAKAKELFEREARLLTKLDHPQITKVLDFFVENGRDYIVLQYIPGISLRQYVETKGKVEKHRLNDWCLQIAEILRYLHGLEPPIVHRDITPDNILVRDDGTNSIALIDFGASNEFIGLVTGTLVGKQAYIPPEQFRGKAEPNSDIYAFGATLHFLLTGTDPEPLAVSCPKEQDPLVSKEFDELVAHCTQLEPADRPTAEELVKWCQKTTRTRRGH